jgi:hypothetical protein
MITRGVDGANDWLFGKGRNDYKRDIFAVAQNVKTRLQSFLGDCFFQSNAGIDWFNLLGDKNLPALELAISSVILNTSGVVGIVEISTTVGDNREVITQYTIDTVYGRFNSSTTQGELNA